MVWARADGLVAFGPAGQIRWRYTRPTEPGDRVPRVMVNGGIAFEKQASVLTAYQLGDGEVAWQWRPEAGHTLDGHATLAGDGGGHVIRRVRLAGNVVRLVRELRDPSDPRYEDFRAAGEMIVVASSIEAWPELTLHGLDRSTGKEQWRVDLPQRYRLSGIAGDAERTAVLACTRTGDLLVVCVDHKTGERLWQYKQRTLRNTTPGSLMRDGLFVLTDAARQAVVIDAGTGTVLWGPDGRPGVSPDVTPMGVTEKGIILGGSTGFAAFGRSSGERLWELGLVRETPGRSLLSPDSGALAEGVFVAAREDAIVAVDADTGDFLWRHRFEPPSPGGYGVLVCENRVVAYPQNALEARLVFLDLRSGKLKGALPLGSSSGGVKVSPILDGLLVVNGEEILTVTPAEAGRSGEAERSAVLSGRAGFFEL